MHTTIYKINKDFLYSAGNYIQYLVINNNELEKCRYIHIYVTPETNTIL